MIEEVRHVSTCNNSTYQEPEAALGYEFEARLGYTVRPYLKPHPHTGKSLNDKIK